MTTPENHLHNEIDKFIEQLRTKLHDKVETWASIEQPEEMLNLEQELQSITGIFQGQMVGSVLEAIHLNLDFVIECQTQALMGGLRNVDWRPVSIQTLGGLEITISSPYTARKKALKRGRKRKKRGRGGSGDYPVLRRLGIVGRATPALLAEVNRQVADGPSEKEAQERLAARGIRLDTKTIRRYVRDFAGIALWQRAVDIHEIQPLESIPLAGKRVVLATDGGRLRTRVNKRGRRRVRHGFKNEWCEPKLFVIYTINDKGRKERLGELVYDGTLQPADGCSCVNCLTVKAFGH